MKYDYAVIGVKPEDDEDAGITFGVILRNMPEYEEHVFMFENLKFIEQGDEAMIEVNFAHLEPGGVRRQGNVDMKPEVEAMMLEMVQQISEDILRKVIDDAKGNP